MKGKEKQGEKDQKERKNREEVGWAVPTSQNREKKKVKGRRQNVLKESEKE